MRTTNIIKSLCLAGLITAAGASLAQSTTPQTNKIVKIKIMDDENGTQTVIDTVINVTTPETDSLDLLIAAEIADLETQAGGTGEKVIIKKICIIDSSNGSGAKVMRRKGNISESDIDRIIQQMNADCKDGKGKKVIVMSEKDLPEGTTVIKEVKKSGDHTAVKVIIRSFDVKSLSEEDKKLLAKENTNFDSKLNVQKIHFYPNPTNGKFKLSFNLEQKGNAEVIVYDAEGKKAYYEPLNDFSGEYSKEIDLSNNSKGIYFLKVTQGKNSSIRKIILE